MMELNPLLNSEVIESCFDDRVPDVSHGVRILYSAVDDPVLVFKEGREKPKSQVAVLVDRSSEYCSTIAKVPLRKIRSPTQQ